MQFRRIGDLEVSLLGLGTSRLASLGSGRSKQDASALLAAARDCGINLIDTADTYGSTAAERWIGELTSARAEDWVVITKIGLATVDLPGPLRLVNQPLKKVKQRVQPGFKLEPASVRGRILRSLRRLRRDRLDVLLLHLPTDDVLTDDELLGALRAAVSEGIVGQFGVSSNDVSLLHTVRSSWGCLCAETAVNPGSPASRQPSTLDGFQVIANHVVGSLASAPGDAMGSSAPARYSPRELLRHAAAVPGVQVVLTGTSSVQHLRENALALESPISQADLLG